MELNREQIIKALERCLTLEYGVACKGCPLSYKDERRTDCLETLMKNTLSLINELTEENERLRAENENKCKDCAGCISNKCDCANIEAYTVEKLLDCAIDNAVCKDNGDGTERLFIYIPKLREIAKEMLEGEK